VEADDCHNLRREAPSSMAQFPLVLAFFSFIESLSNSLLAIKYPKNHITSSSQQHAQNSKGHFLAIKELQGLRVNSVVDTNTCFVMFFTRASTFNLCPLY
jgi:hypothetical protein